MVTIKRNTHEREESNSSTFQVSFFTIKNYINKPKLSARNKFQI